ncbi:hypothetical protein LTR85_007812 [Meristemomyces frigidus]|nr:hypothetical protein LTR85_007812 [Meristemomyces frigidus]
MHASDSTTQPSVQERYRIAWNARMGNETDNVRHDKAAVLLLSWDDTEDDLDVKPEVDDLQSVFEKSYGFKVYNRHFSASGPKPELQARFHLAEFARAENGDRVLLIVYYAGHGYSNEDTGNVGLTLAGNVRPSKKITEAEHRARLHIAWSKVEQGIRGLDADVLLIFDCCQAGALCRQRGSDAYFEFLGSCAGDQATSSAGDHSFTRALICALQKLALEDSPFDTERLQTEIRQYHNFPKDQVPVLSNRTDLSGHIVIDRRALSTADNAATRPAASRLRDSIDITLHFRSHVNEEVIQKTANELRPVKDNKKLGISRIDFHRKSSRIEKAAAKLLRERSTSNVTPTGQSPFSLQMPSAAAVEVGSLLNPNSISPAATPTTPLLPVGDDAQCLQKHPPAPDVPTVLALRIPTHPYTPAPSDTPSRASSLYLYNERLPLIAPRTESRQPRADDQTISYHVCAIARRMRVMLSDMFAWIGRTLDPRTDNIGDGLESQ